MNRHVDLSPLSFSGELALSPVRQLGGQVHGPMVLVRNEKEKGKKSMCHGPIVQGSGLVLLPQVRFCWPM